MMIIMINNNTKKLKESKPIDPGELNINPKPEPPPRRSSRIQARPAKCKLKCCLSIPSIVIALMAKSVHAKVIPDMHGIYRARTPETIISDTHYIPSILWVYMTLCLVTMLLIFKSKSEKQGRKGTILKWLSWKENILITIMMLTMSARPILKSKQETYQSSETQLE